MQGSGLPEALRIGLEDFRLADLRARDLPDIRLDMLIEEGGTHGIGHRSPQEDNPRILRPAQMPAGGV